MERQPPFIHKETRGKVKNKLQHVIDKGYMELMDIKYVESLMYMFKLHKGEDDYLYGIQ